MTAKFIQFVKKKNDSVQELIMVVVNRAGMGGDIVPKYQVPITFRYPGTPYHIILGPVVQSIVSLTSSLRGQLVKCFTNF